MIIVRNVREMRDLKAPGVDVCSTARNIFNTTGCVGRINRKIKKSIRIMLMYTGPPVNLHAKCLHSVCEARSGMVRERLLGRPEKLLIGVIILLHTSEQLDAKYGKLFQTKLRSRSKPGFARYLYYVYYPTESVG